MNKRVVEMKTISCVIAICVSSFHLTLARGEERYSTITIKNESRTFNLIPTIEIFPDGPQPITESGPNTFQYRFRLSESNWFNDANIKLTWKDAYKKNDGTTMDFSQRVVLRLRYSFPETYAVRAFFSNDRSQNEMFRLEHLIDENDQWEKYFRGWQIAGYYRETSGLVHPLSRRAAKIFFEAADYLAENTKDYIVKMSNDAITLEHESVGSTPIIESRINAANSAYWEDLERVYKLTNWPQNCVEAKLLLTDLEVRKTREPDLFTIRYPKKPAAFELAKQHVDSKCSSN